MGTVGALKAVRQWITGSGYVSPLTRARVRHEAEIRHRKQKLGARWPRSLQAMLLDDLLSTARALSALGGEREGGVAAALNATSGTRAVLCEFTTVLHHARAQVESEALSGRVNTDEGTAAADMMALEFEVALKRLDFLLKQVDAVETDLLKLVPEQDLGERWTYEDSW